MHDLDTPNANNTLVLTSMQLLSAEIRMSRLRLDQVHGYINSTQHDRQREGQSLLL